MPSLTQTRDANAILTDEMLARFAKRAPQYDRDNVFFSDDFEELRQAGYLRLAVPHGARRRGPVARRRRAAAAASRLSRRANRARDQHAPLLDRALPRICWRAGDQSLRWLLERRRPAKCSRRATPRAETTSRSCCRRRKRSASKAAIDSRAGKSFGSLSPVWTYLGIHGMDTADPAQPKIVHAFMPRDTEGYRIEETWDVLGMRATRSDDTILDGVFVPDRYVARVVPAGAAGIDFVRPRAVRLGAYRIRQHLLWAVAPGARADDRVGENEALDRPLAPDGLPRGAAAPRRRDGSGVRIHRPSSRSRRGRLVDRCRSRRRMAGEDLRRQVPRGRSSPGGSSIWRSRWPEGSGSSARAGSSSCSATPGSGGSIRRIRC